MPSPASAASATRRSSSRNSRDRSPQVTRSRASGQRSSRVVMVEACRSGRARAKGMPVGEYSCSRCRGSRLPWCDVSAPVISASGLTKRYGDFAAVDGISFEVAPGESFGLLGPNGAGKSTTMRMIGARLDAHGGDLSVLGLDPDTHGPEIRSQLGVVPQAGQPRHRAARPRQPDRLRPLLRHARARSAATRADELLDVRAARRQGESQGRRPLGRHEAPAHHRPRAHQRSAHPAARRADHRPRPAGPAHPVGPAVPAQGAGTTLVLTTHYMDEAEQLCDRLVVVDKGADHGRGHARRS